MIDTKHFLNKKNVKILLQLTMLNNLGNRPGTEPNRDGAYIKSSIKPFTEYEIILPIFFSWIVIKER